MASYCVTFVLTEDDFTTDNKLEVEVEATTVGNAVEYAKDKLVTLKIVKVEMF